MSRNDSSRQLLVIGFGLMLLLLFLVTLIGLVHMRSQNQQLQHMVDVRNVKTDIIVSMRNIARERSLTLYQTAIEQDLFNTDDGIIRMSVLAGQFIGLRDQMRSMDISEQEKQDLEEVLKFVMFSVDQQHEVIALLLAEDYEAANEVLKTRAIPAQERLLQAYDDWVDEERLRSKKDAESMARSYQYALISMLVLGGSLLILGTLISIYIIKKYTRIGTELHELNAELEYRVEERTLELSQTNDSLKQTLATLNQAQGQLIQSEKMASLGSLVAGISHEVNTPIGIGMTAASHLEDEMNKLMIAYDAGNMKRSALEKFMEHAIESSEIIVKNLKRASELIRSFKRVAVDQTSEDWHEINLHEYINDIITSLRPRFKNTKILVENLCDRDVHFYTNPGAIYQIFSNLMINSIVHGYEKGQPGFVYIHCEQEADALSLIYHDDGKGIPPDDLNKVFDPFFTTRRGSGGSGLGLHLVYNLVNTSLKGNIQVVSEPGEGTKFTVVLPKLTADHKAA